MQGSGVGDLVPGGNDDRFVKLHQLVQDRHGSTAGGDVRAGAAILNEASKMKVCSWDFKTSSSHPCGDRDKLGSLLEEEFDDLGFVGLRGQVDGFLSKVVGGIQTRAEIQKQSANRLLTRGCGQVKRGLLFLNHKK